MRFTERIQHVVREDGLSGLVLWLAGGVYDRAVSPYLSDSFRNYSDVTVRTAPSFWEILRRPGASEEYPYESGLMSFIDQLVESGDRVTVIGGGLGVGTVAAARRAGPDGEVVAFEARRESCDKVRETARLNDVEETVSVEHTVVETIDGAVSHDVRVVRARELPESDVLILDCEGAESRILKNLTGQPRHVIVETHAIYGSPHQEVEALMTRQGFSLLDRVVAESAAVRQCRRDGIWVLAFEADNR